MADGELAASSQSPSFEDAADLISKLVAPDTAIELEEDGERELLVWDGSIAKFDLEPEVAAQADLGQVVRARILGESELGIAIILRSRNLFNTRRYGFYIQPAPEGPEGLEVWQAPAQKPKRSVAYWGIELLDRRQAQPSSPEVSESLIQSLQQAAQ